MIRVGSSVFGTQKCFLKFLMFHHTKHFMFQFFNDIFEQMSSTKLNLKKLKLNTNKQTIWMLYILSLVQFQIQPFTSLLVQAEHFFLFRVHLTINYMNYVFSTLKIIILYLNSIAVHFCFSYFYLKYVHLFHFIFIYFFIKRIQLRQKTKSIVHNGKKNMSPKNMCLQQFLSFVTVHTFVFVRINKILFCLLK